MGYSDCTTVLRTMMDVAHRLGEKMVTVITFLDLKDAFSTIGHDFLQQALKYADVPAKLQRLIIQIYKTATGKVRATNAKGEYEYSRSFEIKRGILQGDIMSPVLFVLGFAMIFVLVKNQNSSGTGVKLSEKLTVGNLEYADDAALANVATIEKEKMVAPLKMLGNKTRPQGAAPRAVTELERRDFDERKLWNGVDERHPTVSGWVERELPLDQKVVAIKKAVKEASTNLSTVARIAREVGNLKVSIPKTKCLLAGQGLKQKVTEEEIEKRSVNFEFACEDCGRRFPSKRSLKPHARFCLSQKSEEKFAIERVFDVCETNNGRWFHVQWEGGDRTWEEDWSLLGTDNEKGTAREVVEEFNNRTATPGYQPPNRKCSGQGTAGTTKAEYYATACPGGPFQCPDCPTWWPNEAEMRHRHKAKCTKRPRQRGLESLSAQKVARDLMQEAMAVYGNVECEGAAIEWVVEFVYLGSKFSGWGEQARDVKHRIDNGLRRFGEMYKIWTSEWADWKLKKRLFMVYIQSTVLHGCETWRMDEKTEKALNSFNSRCMARMTGRTIHEEASNPSHNLVAAAYERRRCWLGHVLRMEEGRYARLALQATFEADRQVSSSLVGRTTCGTDLTWEALEELAGDRTAWRKESKTITKELTEVRKEGALRRNTRRTCRENKEWEGGT